MHVRQLGDHLRGGEHADVMQAQGGKDVGLEVRVQRHVCQAGDYRSRPVYAYAVGPGGAWFVEERVGQDAVEVCVYFVDAGGLAVEAREGGEEGVFEAGGVGEKVAHGDFVLLVEQLRAAMGVNAFQDFYLGELGSESLDLVGVVKSKDVVFDELHGRYPADHFCAGGYPEDGGEGHWLGCVDSSFTAGMLEKGLASLVDGHEDAPRDLIWVGCGLVHGLSHGFGSLWRKACHVVRLVMTYANGSRTV